MDSTIYAHAISVAVRCWSQLSRQWCRDSALLEEGADSLESWVLHEQRTVAR